MELQRENLLDTLNKNNIDVIHNIIKNIFNTSDNNLRRLYIKSIIQDIVYDYDSKSLNITISKKGVV